MEGYSISRCVYSVVLESAPTVRRYNPIVFAKENEEQIDEPVMLRHPMIVNLHPIFSLVDLSWLMQIVCIKLMILMIRMATMERIRHVVKRE